MPHSTGYITPHALEVLGGGRIFMEADDLPSLLASIVAGVFKDRVGEDLEVGKQSLFYPYVTVNSMPADFALVVVAWWAPEREPHWDKVRSDLNACISWDSSLCTEAHLTIVGAPRSQQATHTSRRHTSTYDVD